MGRLDQVFLDGGTSATAHDSTPTLTAGCEARWTPATDCRLWLGNFSRRARQQAARVTPAELLQEQLEIFGHQREQMRTVIAKWSTLLEEDVMWRGLETRRRIRSTLESSKLDPWWTGRILPRVSI
jgi:hypothetical protein